MTTFGDHMVPMFPWSVIEQALLAIPQARWEAASRIGCCTDDAARMIRAVTSDDLRRELERIAGRPLAANNPARCHPSAPPADS